MLKPKITGVIIAAIYLISCQSDTVVRSDSGDFRGIYHAAVTFANLSDSTRLVVCSFKEIMEFKAVEFSMVPEGPRETWPPCAGISGYFLLLSPEIIRFSQRPVSTGSPCQESGQYLFGDYRIEKQYKKIRLHRLNPPVKCYLLIELTR